MSNEAIIIISSGLAFGLANAAYIRWARWRLERDTAREHPAE